MPRDWTDVFVTGDGARVRRPPATRSPSAAAGFFRRLRENLSKTRQALGAEIQATLFEGDLDERDLGAPRGGADHGRRRRAHDGQVVAQLEQEAETASWRAARR